MALELVKEPIRINQVVGDNFSQTLVEGDIIVPDVKPDIQRILQVDGTAVISGSEIQQDKVIVNGTVNFKILYVPDISDPEDAVVKSINASSNFTHQVELKGARPNMRPQLETDIEHIEFNMLNGRKLNVKAVVSMDCKVLNSVSLDMVTDIAGEEDVEILKKNVKAYSIVAESDEEMMIREDLDIPSGKPSIKDLLKLDVKISGKDVKLIDNKIVVKGELDICTLYVGEMDENSIQFMEHEVPFTEIFDLSGVTEEMHCDLEYAIKDVYYQVKEDSDGEGRILGVEVSLGVNTKASDYVTMDIVADSYSPDCDIIIEKKTFNIDEVIDDKKAQTTIKEVIDLPADIPDIVQVYNVVTKPYLSETRVENGKVIVEGVIDTYILYLSDSADNPVFSYKQEVPFRQNIDVAGASADMTCDVKVEVDHCSYSMNGSAEVEVRYILGVSSKVVKTSQVELITKAETAAYTAAKAQPRPSVVIYFCQKGDTLWEIAKRYRTTLQKLMATNKLDNADYILPGQQLII